MYKESTPSCVLVTMETIAAELDVVHSLPLQEVTVTKVETGVSRGLVVSSFGAEADGFDWDGAGDDDGPFDSSGLALDRPGVWAVEAVELEPLPGDVATEVESFGVSVADSDDNGQYVVNEVTTPEWVDVTTVTNAVVLSVEHFSPSQEVTGRIVVVPWVEFFGETEVWVVDEAPEAVGVAVDCVDSMSDEVVSCLVLCSVDDSSEVNGQYVV